MPDRRRSACRDRGRQCGRKDEAAGKATDEIDQVLRRRDIAAHHAERLAERAFDDGDPVHEPFAFGDAAAARSVKADGVDLVDIAHRAVAFADVEDFGDRRNVAVHRIDALECHQLRAAGFDRGEQFVEMRDVVVPELQALRTAVADTLDHRRVVERVRQHDAVGQARGERAECRPVRDIAAGEQQRRFLAVEVGQLGLEQNVLMVGAADVARAPRPCAAAVERFVHRAEHIGMLAHAEIVVRAPDGDLAYFPGIGVAARARKRALLAFDVGEHAVIAGFAQAVELLGEKGFVVHALNLPGAVASRLAPRLQVPPWLVPPASQCQLVSATASDGRRACLPRSWAWRAPDGTSRN